jgi:hypothetical protein
VELPGARFVAPGAQVAWDGEQLTVNLLHIGQGTPGRELANTMPPSATIFFAQFGVNLLRAVPSLSGEGHAEDMLPEPSEQEAAAMITMLDAGALALASVDIHKNHLINAPGEGFAIGPVSPFGPEDGLVGSRCLVTVSLT